MWTIKKALHYPKQHYLLVGVGVLIAVVLWSSSWWWAHAHGLGGTTQAWMQALAFAAAGWFFLWKAYSGYLVVDCKMSLSFRRQAANPDFDHISVTVTINKGERGTIWLLDAQARFLDAETGYPILVRPLVGIERFNHQEAPGATISLKLDEIHNSVPRLSLAPGDGLQVAAYALVPAGRAILIDSVILAQRPNIPPPRVGAQWRAADVSLPIQR